MSVYRKKILHIITKGSPFGGAQKYVFDLATNLPDEFESLVAVGVGEELPRRLADFSTQTGKVIRIIPLSFLERDVSFFKEWHVLWQLVAVIRKEKPDIIHLNSSKIGALGALAGRIAGVPRIIFTAHGWAFNERRHDLHRTLIWIASWFTALFAHKVIAVSEKDQRQGLALPGMAHKMLCIHNGIQPIPFKSQEEARKEIEQYTGKHFSPDMPVIGTIAELHKNKNLLAAIDAVARLKNIFLVIIGEGEERHALEEEIRRKNLENYVMLTGRIEHAAEYLRAFNIFLLPSFKEGLPYTLLEAGLAGLPSIASNVGGIPEIITHKESGFLVRPQVKEIALGLQYLLDNPTETEDYGKKLQEKIKEQFSFEAMIRQTVAVYSENPE